MGDRDEQDRDEQDEREYRAALRRLKLVERRVKLWLAALFITAPFVYLIGAAVAAGFGASPAELPWPYLVPFIVAGLVFIFNLDLRDVLVLFGNIGTAMARFSETGRGAQPGAGDDEGGR